MELIWIVMMRFIFISVILLVSCKPTPSPETFSQAFSAAQESVSKSDVYEQLITLEDKELLAFVNGLSLKCGQFPAPTSYDLNSYPDFADIPQNDAEFKEGISLVKKEARKKMVYQMCDLRNRSLNEETQKKISILRKSAASYRTVLLLGIFDLKSMGKEGALFELPGVESYIAEQMEKATPTNFDSPETVFALSGAQEVKLDESSKSYFRMFAHQRPEVNETVSTTVSNQTPYYKPFYPYEMRTSDVSEEGDPLNHHNTEMWIYDFVIKKIIETEIFTHTPADLHEENKVMIKEMLAEANSKDSEMTFSPIGELARQGAQSPFVKKGKFTHFTDIELDRYFKRISSSKSIKYAIGGASLGVLVGSFIAKVVSSARLTFAFNAVKYLGFEPVFSVAAIYLGSKQMYLLHRYYSHMAASRRQSIVAKENFNPKVASSNFNPEDVVFGYKYKQLTQMSIIYGASAGYMIKALTNPAILRLVRILSTDYVFKRGTSKFSRVKNRYYGMSNSRNVRNVVGSTKFHSGILKRLKNLPGVGKLIYGLRGLFGPVSWGITAGELIADTLITGVSMWYIIKSRLDWTGAVLNDVHLSPSTNISLSLNDEQHSFEKATFETFFPLCGLMTRAANQVGIPSEEDLRMRSESCMQYMIQLAGLKNESEVQARFPRVYDETLKVLRSSRFETSDSPSFVNRVDQLIQKAQKYPPNFKIVWLAGIKAIYPIQGIPSFYWKLEEEMLSRGLTKKDISRGNIESEVMNIQRFTYMIDYLAMTQFSEKNNLGGDIFSVSQMGKKVYPYQSFIDYYKYHYHKTFGFFKEAEAAVNGEIDSSALSVAAIHNLERSEPPFSPAGEAAAIMGR